MIHKSQSSSSMLCFLKFTLQTEYSQIIDSDSNGESAIIMAPDAQDPWASSKSLSHAQARHESITKCQYLSLWILLPWSSQTTVLIHGNLCDIWFSDGKWLTFFDALYWKSKFTFCLALEQRWPLKLKQCTITSIFSWLVGRFQWRRVYSTSNFDCRTYSWSDSTHKTLKAQPILQHNFVQERKWAVRQGNCNWFSHPFLLLTHVWRRLKFVTWLNRWVYNPLEALTAKDIIADGRSNNPQVCHTTFEELTDNSLQSIQGKSATLPTRLALSKVRGIWFLKRDHLGRYRELTCHWCSFQQKGKESYH